jgi:hypothetical protein
MKCFSIVFLWNLFSSSFPFSKIINSKSSLRLGTQQFLTGEDIQSGVQLAFNAIPIAVGIYILQAQDKTQKDSLNALEKALLVQDKNLKDALLAQDKTQKDSLNALEKALQIQDKNLKDALLVQDKNQKDALNSLEKLFRDVSTADKDLWNERFNNFIFRINNTSDKIN